MRMSNQLEALLSLERDFRAPELQSALRYVQEELPARLLDPQYRSQLAAIGFVDPAAHPEMVACNWFNAMGALLKHGLATEEAFMDLFARLIVYYWGALSQVVVILRRERGAFQYHDFEYLAMRAESWLRRHPNGIFPRGTGRRAQEDQWLEADSAQGARKPEPSL